MTWVQQEMSRARKIKMKPRQNPANKELQRGMGRNARAEIVEMALLIIRSRKEVEGIRDHRTVIC